MDEKQYSRLYGLDILKLVCTFLVVYIHAGKDSGLLNTISIVAVPVFFIISGVLYESFVLPGGGQKKQIVRLLKLFISAFVFYSIWSGIICPLLSVGSVKATLSEQFSMVPIIKLILLNATTYGYHLWYLSALIYVLILAPIMDRLVSQKLFKMICFVLMVAGVVLPWACILLNIPFRNELVRNFLFEGFPLFYIGRWLIKDINSSTSTDGSRKKSIIGVIGIALFVLLIAEERIYGLANISTPVTVVAFILATYLVWISIRIGVENKYFKMLAYAGGLSTSVYIIHLWVLLIMKLFGEAESVITAVVCFLISILISGVYKKIMVGVKTIRN